MDALTPWQHPSHYAGFSPDGDYLMLAQHRESDALDRSNYACAFKALRKACEGLADAPEEPLYDAFPGRDGCLSPRSSGWVYDFRASHPLVGWIEYLLVRKDAPEKVLALAQALADRIEDYPILDEDHYSELEWGEVAQFWSDSSVRDRLEFIRSSGSTVSMFAARRADFPQDDDGRLFDYLRD